MASVLYDATGPIVRVRNSVYSLIVVAAAADSVITDTSPGGWISSASPEARIRDRYVHPSGVSPSGADSSEPVAASPAVTTE